jgi:hypothetical protein
MSLGRIPVFVNTDCVLPYEKFIDWKNLLVWVEEKDLSDIAEKVSMYHKSLSPEQFVERQKELRSIYEEWLSPQGFFKNFCRHFERT